MIHIAFFVLISILFLYGIVLLVPEIVFVCSKKEIQDLNAPKTFISILIPVRNEEKNLEECLGSISELHYPKELFEIIVINDHSTDNTKSIAESFCSKIPNLKVADNLPGSFGKKSAITVGVNSALGELIVTTDGDCILPEGWLQKIATLYENENPVFIAGPVIYKKQGGIFRDLLQIEQLVLQTVSAGSMKMGVPLMCSGANLAYRKDFFVGCGGYQNDIFTSGDDMMLMQKAQNSFPGRLRFLADKDAIVKTSPAAGFKDAIQQRSRWLSKFSAYRSIPITATGILVFLANFAMIFLGFISLCNSDFLGVFIYAISGKMLIDLLLLSLAVPFFGEPRLLLLAPLGEVYYPFQAIISAGARLSGKFSWKGRNWKT